MSSRRGGGGSSSNSNSKGKNNVEQQLKHVSLQDDEQWEVISRKPNKNRNGTPNNNNNNNLKPHYTANATSSARGNFRAPSSDAYRAPQPQPQPQTAIAPPLERGWNWKSRHPAPAHTLVHNHDDDADDNNSDALDCSDDDDDDDDDLMSDEFDSDASEKSHDTLKNSKWFSKFFHIIDNLKPDEVNDLERQWHCPACQRGPGSIDWYRGLQPLLTHAKTKGGARMKLHRKFSQLLEEELKRIGTSVVPPGESLGRWKRQEEEKDHEIVWPPMVVIMNTHHVKDDNDKWLGMGNQELLDIFNDYHPLRARHSYGPQGHRGMSVLIFEASPRGYLEAERLHNNYVKQGRDRHTWIHRSALISAGGKRILYCYLAIKEDLDVFNKHSQGKSKLKYELRSHHETVMNQVRQMSEDNQHLNWYKDNLMKEKRHSKAVEESLHKVSERLHQKMEETRIVRQRTKLQHEENREEMLSQEEFFKEQIKMAYESREAKEENFERLQQEMREKVKSSNANADESLRRRDEISKFIKCQDREMDEYVEQRETLIKAHRDKMDALKKQFWEEELKLEEDLNSQLTSLMQKYA